MLATAKLLNLAVRFIVELGLLAAITTAAWQLPSTPALRLAGAAGAVLAVSTAWVLVVHDGSLPTSVQVGARQRPSRSASEPCCGCRRHRPPWHSPSRPCSTPRFWRPGTSSRPNRKEPS
jgi:hypothetical protein